MLAKVLTAGTYGVDGIVTIAETDIARGLPAVEIVGLPDAAVKESRERVRSALRNSNYMFPNGRITINLSPADRKKAGSGYDLPVAVSMLLASGQERDLDLTDTAVFGELGLDGTVRPVRGALSMALCLKEKGVKRIIVPFDNAKEAALCSGVDIYGVRTLREAILFLKGEEALSPEEADLKSLLTEAASGNHGGDFAEVKGQDNVKRAMEVAAAGHHHMLMVGTPGTGKTMLAERIPGILPPLSEEECLEVTRIHSAAGLLEEDHPVVTRRPFRSPHAGISEAGMSGGGTMPLPGEISLAHLGVLYLDEMPEFNKKTLELLRQPLEDRRLTITRVSGSATFPANIMLVGSMNPCPCGYSTHPTIPCHCTDAQIERYFNRVSGPLWDRMDVQVEMPPVDLKIFQSDKTEETSAQVRRRVIAARNIQLERYKGLSIRTNSELSGDLVKKYCALDDALNSWLIKACEKLNFSGRGYHKVLKLSRTVADLGGSETITKAHLAEALQYRGLDRAAFWLG